MSETTADGIRHAEKQGFEAFMASPSAKVLVSLCPPFEHMEKLLEAAFSAGFGHGCATILADFMTAMMKDKEI